MNLITRLRNLFCETRQPETMTHATTDNSPLYQQLLSALQQACANVPGGKAFVICGNGEFGIQLTWTPEATAPATPKQVYCIEGNGKATSWEELSKEEVAEEQPINTIQSQAVQDSSPKKEEKAPRQQQMMQQLIGHLEEHYNFRYNRLADRTECAAKNSSETAYTPIDQRTLNSIVLRAMDEGIACWDRDVKRYVESAHVPAYHPFIHYFNNLPEWDGKDRVSELARRVSDDSLWINSFHRWMLACTVQWMGKEAYSQRANSVAPILISTQQGLGKSTFCRMLLPKPLQDYFTESFDLNNASGAENKLAACGLINIDEFDRLPATRLPQLKNLMQMESLRIRRAYKRNAEPLPRIASFIGTSNCLDLLTDLSGSRRFICVEVERAIDCTTPIDYGQLYAQLKHEI
ncbi:MAG TPA: virulence-associated E family protein, partial [Candidatus Bacteroides avicola]|nr:virulence-associated E family protein [Candidatus Bacteroides avicola]